jgi:hypothetical protein
VEDKTQTCYEMGVCQRVPHFRMYMKRLSPWPGPFGGIRFGSNVTREGLNLPAAASSAVRYYACDSPTFTWS